MKEIYHMTYAATEDRSASIYAVSSHLLLSTHWIDKVRRAANTQIRLRECADWCVHSLDARHKVQYPHAAAHCLFCLFLLSFQINQYLFCFSSQWTGGRVVVSAVIAAGGGKWGRVGISILLFRDWHSIFPLSLSFLSFPILALLIFLPLSERWHKMTQMGWRVVKKRLNQSVNHIREIL